MAYLRAMEAPDAADALTGLLEEAPAGLDLERVRLNRNLTPEGADALWGDAGMRVVGAAEHRIGFSTAHWTALGEDVRQALETWHRRHPDTAGATERNLASGLHARLRPETLAAILPELGRDGIVVHDGQRVRLATHEARLNAADEKMWRRVEPVLGNAGPRSISVSELAGELGMDPRQVERFLVRASRLGIVAQVSKNRFYLPDELRRLAEIAEDVSVDAGDGLITAARFRDQSGIGRNLAIEVLEYFNKTRFTRRVGDGHELLRTAEESFPAGRL